MIRAENRERIDVKSKSSSLPTVDDCQGCGACCLHMGFPSYVQGNELQPAEEHWVSMPEDLKGELLEYIQHYQSPADGELDGACVWFDQQERNCMHHEHRPNVCRDFKVGSKDCVDWREHFGVQ